jgi:hypothetical protein
MQNARVPTTLRRSSRVPAAVSILVTSLDGKRFSEVCETLVVNAHGCAMLAPAKLDAGVPLHLHSKEGREAAAHVVYCQPFGSDNSSWRLGASLDQPENFWGLRDFPKDWPVAALSVPPRVIQTLVPTVLPPPPKEAVSHSSEAALGRLARQLEAPLMRMIAESMRPLQLQVSTINEQVASLNQKLAHREANPSRFEVSLSSIPPELEQQLELRLRRDLGPKVLEEARQQSAQLLAAAKATLDQRAAETHEHYLQRVAEELAAVEKRAQNLSAHIAQETRQYLHRGLDELHDQLLNGGHSLKRLGEELLDFLQQSLNQEFHARRSDLEQLRASVSSESSRLQEQIEEIDRRIAKLDEATQRLEAGLDQRLSQMSGNTVRDTRSQLEAAASEILDELTARSAKTVADQQDAASENMRIIQKGIVSSASDSLKGEATAALQDFERSMEELAQASAERWRLRLASSLNALAQRLGERLQMQADSDDDAPHA